MGRQQPFNGTHYQGSHLTESPEWSSLATASGGVQVFAFLATGDGG